MMNHPIDSDVTGGHVDLLLWRSMTLTGLLPKLLRPILETFDGKFRKLNRRFAIILKFSARTNRSTRQKLCFNKEYLSKFLSPKIYAHMSPRVFVAFYRPRSF